ncbi:hypothetical protein ACQKNO_01335 [Bacillus paramycoides]|uniref:hypothetical protein n=1 Tax=Bacillus paramycoides TaxID=2026194 RepID=UPI003CFE7A42
MMNSIKNLLAGTTKVKTEEQARQAIDKLQVQENNLQNQITQAQLEHTRVSNALEIMEASLIINPDSKESKTNKTLGEKKIEELNKQIEAAQVKLSEVAEKKQKAVRELHRSRGEIARKYNVKARRDMAIAHRFNRAFNLEIPFGIETHYDPKGFDLGVEYGLGEMDSLDPHSEGWKFLVSLSDEDSAEGDKQAEAIARELEEAIKAVFEKNNIALSNQTLTNLSRI